MWLCFVRRLSSAFTTVFVFGVVLPPTWPKTEANAFVTEGNLQSFNKSIRDEIHTQRWLQALEQKVKRNGPSTPNADSKGNDMAFNLSVDSRNNLSLNVSGRDNIYDPKTIISQEVPIVVRSNAIEKNVVTFALDKENRLKENIFITRVNLWVFIWRREPKKRKSGSSSPTSPSTSMRSKKSRSNISARELKSRNRRRNRRNKKIKIKVFLVDEKGSRGKRIAELKKQVISSEWQRIGLPVSLFKSISATPNNTTLRLRVECRRCSRKTQLVLPGNGKSRRCHRKGKSKRKNKKKKSRRVSRKKKSRRRRRKCSRASAKKEESEEKKAPFIVIEDKPRSTRLRRSSANATETGCRQDSKRPSPNHSPNGHELQNHTSPPSGQSCCRKITTYTSFSELNLENTIVYPSEFPWVYCVGTCIDEGSTSSFSTLPSRHTSQNLLHRLLHKERDKASDSQQSNFSKQVHSSGDQPNTTTGQLIAIIRNRNRLKQQKPCVPMKTTGLKILYFAHDNNLYQSNIPNMLVTDCGCNSHRH